MDATRELAKVHGFDLEIEDHGWLVLSGHFEYEGGGVQGIGYFADASFIMRLLAAIGVHQLSKCKGKSCWVTHTHDAIQRIEPLHKEDGTPFIIKDWEEWREKTGPWPSAYEMQTGKKP